MSPLLGDATTTAIGAAAVASMIFGYVLLAGLWYFVFREKPQAKRERLEREALEQARYRRSAGS